MLSSEILFYSVRQHKLDLLDNRIRLVESYILTEAEQIDLKFAKNCLNLETKFALCQISNCISFLNLLLLKKQLGE